MRPIFLILFALRLGAQGLTIPCEVSPKTLRLLEAVPPLRDMSIPYENRIGALRVLAERHPDDFFIQRAYQDSFRHSFYLADEFDHALAMYRKRAPDPLSRYYEARLLMYAQPRQSREALEELLRTHAEFVWPHLEFVEWSAMPGQRSADDSGAHFKAFRAVCPNSLPIGVRATVPDDPAILRTAIEQRNSWIDLPRWPQLWSSQERAGISDDLLRTAVRGDMERIKRLPFLPDPDLLHVYQEASRILKDPAVIRELQMRVDHEAPDSQLAFSLFGTQWFEDNPRPKQAADHDNQKSYREYQRKEIMAQREWFQRWPNVAYPAGALWQDLKVRAMSGESGIGSEEDLAIVDRIVRVHERSPDASVEFPPFETALARVYVTGKVRLDQVPKLLDMGLRNIEKLEKYRTSQELVPEPMRNRGADWREMTWQQTEEIRADYFLATNHPSEARSLIEQALAQADSKQPGRSGGTGWMRRLGDTDARQDRVEDALAHYQASLNGMRKEFLSRAAEQPAVAAIRQYYLAHGGTEEKWPEWATAGTNLAGDSVGRTAPDFQQQLPQFTAKDLSGRIWQLGDLNGKATLVSFWATWCGPCRGEHAGIQELYERIKDRKDVQILTISVDDSPGAVRDYMKTEKYTFPVVHSPELAKKLFPYAGLPANFLVNAKGVRTNFYGFTIGPAGLGQVLKDLESAAKSVF